MSLPLRAIELAEIFVYQPNRRAEIAQHLKDAPSDVVLALAVEIVYVASNPNTRFFARLLQEFNVKLQQAQVMMFDKPKVVS